MTYTGGWNRPERERSVKDEKISGRQFLILTFVLMLSPLIHAIPSRVAEAGKAGWIVMIPAVLPIALLLYFLFRCLERLPDHCGMGDIYHQAFGESWGRICCGINVLWMAMLVLLSLRFYAERFVSTVYPGTGLLLFYLIMILLQAWMVKGEFGAFVRTGKIMFWVVVVALIAVLGMSVSMVKLYNVWPFWDANRKGVWISTFQMSAVMSFVVPSSFLLGRVNWKTSKRGAYWWVICLTGTMMALAGIMIGVFGGAFVQRLAVPFFHLAKEVTFHGTIAGVEIIVAAMWVMADAAMIGMQIFAAGEAVKGAVSVKRPDLFRVTLVCLMLPLCYLLPKSSLQMDRIYCTYGIKINAVMGFLLPASAILVGKFRRKW